MRKSECVGLELLILENTRLLMKYYLPLEHKQRTNPNSVSGKKRHKTSYRAVNGFHLLMLWLVSMSY